MLRDPAADEPHAYSGNVDISSPRAKPIRRPQDHHVDSVVSDSPFKSEPGAVDTSGRVFATTHWTAVLAARGDGPEARLALGQLCEAYWTPVYRFLRREGRDDETARELTQEFFARVLAGRGFHQADPRQGRFRSFLLGAVKHFLGDRRAFEQAAKRGGGTIPEPLEAPWTEGGTGGGTEIPDWQANIPDAYFDRQWAIHLIERSFARLSGELAEEGKSAHFSILKPWLIQDAAGAQADAARRMGMSEGAVKVAIHRLRKRFRAIVRDEIAQTVPSSSEVETELRYLVEVLASI